VTQPAAITAEITYAIDTGAKPVNETFGPNNIRRRNIGAKENRAVTIADGRPRAAEFTLDANGFAFVDHPTAMRDFFDPAELQTVYYPEVEALVQTLTIPRGQVAMATGKAARDARAFALRCEFGSPTSGTSSIAFLDYAFKTLEYGIKVTVNADGTWSYDQLTLLKIAGSDQLFRHTDRSTLRKVGEPTPNWLMRSAGT
jgi:hypothetical protein